MAESVIPYVVQSLSDQITQKAKFLKGVNGQVQWLRDELQGMQCFLQHADAQQEGDKRIKNWVAEIRKAAYDAEDIVDTFVCKIESWRRQGFIKRYAHFPKELFDRRKVGKDIAALRERIFDIARRRETYEIQSIGDGATSTSRERLHQLRRSSPRGVDQDIIGLKNDTTQLVARLLEKKNQLAVISLVGMGGIGKTTLAKKVFNDSDVRCHFNCVAWIYVSQEYKLKDMLVGIIKEVMEPSKELHEKFDDLQEPELETMLYEHLLKKQYLVVLDDIWTTEAWDLVKGAFPGMGNRSKVMLTTRNREVALHADPRSAPYELRFLSNEESWELFLRKTFHDGKCPQEFEDIGRRIVGKCDGLPLAVIVAAGLLSHKSLESEWKRILDNIDSHFAKGKGRVLPILALSYIDLPHYLKSCFLYLGLFPEDCVISTHRLFALWIAEGLIPHCEERMEVIAEDYLIELIDRNMVQVVRTSASKRIKECRIHDVLRDLSILKAKEEIYLKIHMQKSFQLLRECRHLAIHHDDFNQYFASIPSVVPKLRSLVLFHSPEKPRDNFSSLDIICTNFKLLRMLDVEQTNISKLQRKIGNLINLRYLNLSGTEINKLPSSMRYLQSLQTLDMSGTPLQKIPKFISKMENLRHLYMTASLHCKGQLRIDTLKNLQTASIIHINNWELGSSGNSLNLRKLGVELSRDSDVNRFFNSVAELEQLESLHLCLVDFHLHFLYLEGLSQVHHLTKLRLTGAIRWLPGPQVFPPNIAHLTLHDSRLSLNPMHALMQLPKLSILRLGYWSYLGNEMEIPAGGFPLLKFLEIDYLPELRKLAIDDGAMPRLKHFRISRCNSLLELPVGIMSATTLQELEICSMPSEFENTLPHSDFYKVKHIPSITYK